MLSKYSVLYVIFHIVAVKRIERVKYKVISTFPRNVERVTVEFRSHVIEISVRELIRINWSHRLGIMGSSQPPISLLGGSTHSIFIVLKSSVTRESSRSMLNRRGKYQSEKRSAIHAAWRRDRDLLKKGRRYREEDEAWSFPSCYDEVTRRRDAPKIKPWRFAFSPCIGANCYSSDDKF